MKATIPVPELVGVLARYTTIGLHLRYQGEITIAAGLEAKSTHTYIRATDGYMVNHVVFCKRPVGILSKRNCRLIRPFLAAQYHQSLDRDKSRKIA